MNWLAYGIFMLFFLGLPLAAEVETSRLNKRLRTSGQRTTARIVNQRSPINRFGQHGLPIPIVRFTTSTGEVVRAEGKGNRYLTDKHIGDDVDVLYDTAAPDTFIFACHATQGVDFKFLLFMLAVAGLLTWLAIASPKGHHAAPPRPAAASR